MSITEDNRPSYGIGELPPDNFRDIEERSELNAAEEPEELLEAPRRRQHGQLIEVFLEGADAFTVSVDNRDRIAYETVQNKHKWPKAADAQNLAMTFVCWSAAKRTGATAMPFEQWRTQLIDWELVEETAADPTRPTA
jgi:hypothetical protein